MKKLILIVPVLAHYRKDLYEIFLNCKDFDFRILAGRNYQGIKSLYDSNYIIFNYASFRFFKHRFYYLKGSLKYIFSVKPEIIISSGVDFHLLHTILLFLLYRIILRNDFYWWSHGTVGNQGKIGVLIRKLVYKMSSGILVYSRKGKENLLKMGIKPDRLVIVNNCINFKDYGYLNQKVFNEPENRNDFTILFSGRLISKAKVDVLIRAIGILCSEGQSGIKCYIIGDGDDRILKKLVIEQGIQDVVTFLGPKYGEDAHQYFLQSDIFVYPGGIGLSILHALSFGLPVITTNDYSQHFPEVELLVPGKNGDLYIEGSSQDLTEKIMKWKEKVSKSSGEIKRNCIDIIEKLGYLPDRVSSTVLNFLTD